MSDRRAALPTFPPGPSRLAALRDLRAMGATGDLSQTPAYFTELARRYGPLAHWQVLGAHFYFVAEPALIEELLVTKNRDYSKGPGTLRLKRILGEGLLTSEQPLHLRVRRMLQPAFHRERIARYGVRMVAETKAHLESWHDGAAMEIDREMMRLTLAIAAETLFGANVEAEAETVRNAIYEIMVAYPSSQSVVGELLDQFPFLPIVRRFNTARDRLDRIIFELIEARRAQSDDTHDDLLAMLLDARDDDGAPMSDVQIRDEAMTIFLAGHETTANALAWTWYLLARHPNVEARLHAELDDVLGAREPSVADLPQLRYTRDVFAETMRLYPPAWAVSRRAIRATTLGDWTIPSGAVMFASQNTTHRDPHWWLQPDAYRPERWASETAALPKFAYFPFGGGNRLCIGEPFAWMEGTLVLATIARAWRFRLVDPNIQVATDPLVTLRPKTAIRVRAEHREAVVTA
jgi:cytochrome P450